MKKTQFKAIPSTVQLAPTLAQRVMQLREMRNLTLRDLSELTRFPLRRLDDIECGLETWFSSTDRQLLARALVVEPSVLQEVESKSKSDDEIDIHAQEMIMRNMSAQILSGLRDLECPSCGSSLKCSVQEGFDLAGERIYLPKAFCPRCPFILK
jgi:transcriptional regulator with XRE-family HTH domain